jgi:hypothetical protein
MPLEYELQILVTVRFTGPALEEGQDQTAADLGAQAAANAIEEMGHTILESTGVIPSGEPHE